MKKYNENRKNFRSFVANPTRALPWTRWGARIAPPSPPKPQLIMSIAARSFSQNSKKKQPANYILPTRRLCVLHFVCFIPYMVSENCMIFIVSWSYTPKLFMYQPTIPRINSETNPPLPHYQCCLQNIWDSFFAQASVSLLCRYAAILSRGKMPDLFLQSGPFQNFHKFF